MVLEHNTLIVGPSLQYDIAVGLLSQPESYGSAITVSTLLLLCPFWLILKRISEELRRSFAIHKDRVEKGR